MYISKVTQEFVKSREKFSNVYYNKQSVFTDWVRKETFLLKTKHTKSKTKDTLLYIPVNLSKIICTAYTDYIIGWWLKISDMDFLKDLESNINLSKILYDTILKSCFVWYWIIRVRHTSNTNSIKIEDIKIDKIPTRNYYPNFDWLNIWEWIERIKEHNIISEVEENENWKVSIYLYVDNYKKEDNKRIYTKTKYKTSSNYKDEFKFWLWRQFEWWIELKNEYLEYLPLFIFSNSETNEEDEGSNWNDIFWLSDLDWIMELLQEYNDRYSQVSVEFIKHLNSSMSIPERLKRNIDTNKKRDIVRQKNWETLETIEEDTGFKIDNVDKVFVHWQNEQPAHYLSKNIEIEKAIVRLEKVVRDISSIKSIPLQFFNWKDDNAQETTATGILYGRDRFNKVIIQKQNSIRQELKKLFAYINYLVNNNYEFMDIDFVDPSPVDKSLQADYFIKLKNAWIISDDEIMKWLFWRDEERIWEEISKIRDSEKIQSEINTVLPTLT